MIKLRFSPLLASALGLGSTLLFTLAPSVAAQSVGFASQVVDYTPGTGISTAYTNANSALGKPGGNVGSGTLNPFSPNFAGSELTGIGMSGQLTLGLSNFVTITPGIQQIGIFGNVGLINSGATGQPAAANPATAFGVRSVLISVSADGINFVPVNGGNLITSTLPANFYTNADTTNVNAPPPANPTFADFGKPFTGTLADFNGATYAQTLTILNGSAGGTWLDLSSTGLSQVGFIRFNEPASSGVNGGIFYLNGVSSNAALLGLAVPEPSTFLLCGLMVGLGWLWRRQSKVRATILAICLAAALGGTVKNASAQMLGFSNIQNWIGTGSNQAALVISWNDGKAPEALLWGYRFNGSATGLQMLQAIDAADPRLQLSYIFGGSFVYSIGYDLNNNGGTFTVGTPGTSPANFGSENGTASDSSDHYAEGLYSKFWGYKVSEGSPYGGGGVWTDAQTGAADRALLNGSWDAYSLSYDTTNYSVPDPAFPSPAAAVPEPATVWMLALGIAVVVGCLRARRVIHQN